MAPQQIQLMNLIQLHSLEFEKEILKELEENPALEKIPEETIDEENPDINSHENEGNESIDTDFDVEQYLFDDEPSYKTYTNNYSPDDDEFDSQTLLTEGQSLYDYLIEQIHLTKIDGEDLQIAKYIIGNIDNDGYLRREIKSLVNDMAFSLGISTTVERIEDILTNYVQKLDPLGVGARNLRECLLLQIEKKISSKPAIFLAHNILLNHFEALSNKHYHKILHKYEINEDFLKSALDEIAKLSPRVGGNFETQTISLNQEIIPDFSIYVKEGDVSVALNSKNAPQLRVSDEYKDILTSYSRDKNSDEHKQAALFVKQKLDAAKWYIDAINQRQNTLMQTINAIVELQKDYFLSGDERDIKPMILKDIADITGFDISTISRVVKSKYADSPNGIVYLKNLFSDSLTNDEGEEVSTKEIKNHLLDIIEHEDKQKPYTDDALVKILKDRGYNIARRTVAKYREQLNILVARLRKEL